MALKGSPAMTRGESRAPSADPPEPYKRSAARIAARTGSG
jgi:hypothetical protein